MPAFRGTDFEVELPEQFNDESTYAFAFPARSNFRPSLVVKTERLAAPVELPSYVEGQLDKLKQIMANLSVVRSGPAMHGKLKAHASVFDWGEGNQRIRQKQYYLLLDDPLRVVTLTGTNLEDTFGQTEALFDAIFLSFHPAERQGKRA